MAKMTINGTVEVDGEHVVIKDGALSVDGSKVMDLPDGPVTIEADGAIGSITADRSVTVRSVTQGATAGTTHAHAFAHGGASAAAAAAASGIAGAGSAGGTAFGGTTFGAAGGPDAAAIIRDVHKSIADAFPPGFPFHNK